MTGIRVIVGLGNPGTKYVRTRHNAGFWFVDALAQTDGLSFRQQAKMHGALAQTNSSGQVLRLLKPQTYMNHSGIAVASTLAYFKIEPQHCLVVHDDLDLEPGVVKLKFGGGHGGQNGVRDIIKHVGHGDFYRLRLGIGRPASKQDVLDWVLGQPRAADEEAIVDALARAMSQLPLLIDGNFNEAMKCLHTRHDEH